MAQYKSVPDYECIAIGFRLDLIKKDKMTLKKQNITSIGLCVNYYSMVVLNSGGLVKVVMKNRNEKKQKKKRPKNHKKGVEIPVLVPKHPAFGEASGQYGGIWAT